MFQCSARISTEPRTSQRPKSRSLFSGSRLPMQECPSTLLSSSSAQFWYVLLHFYFRIVRYCMLTYVLFEDPHREFIGEMIEHSTLATDRLPPIVVMLHFFVQMPISHRQRDCREGWRSLLRGFFDSHSETIAHGISSHCNWPYFD